MDGDMLVPVPCRCGATPVVHPRDWREEGDVWAEVRCESPTCPVHPIVDDGLYGDIDGNGDEASRGCKDAAIKRWNEWMGRAPSPAGGEAEAIAQEIERIMDEILYPQEAGWGSALMAVQERVRSLGRPEVDVEQLADAVMRVLVGRQRKSVVTREDIEDALRAALGAGKESG